jgi:hypothetical protein
MHFQNAGVICSTCLRFLRFCLQAVFILMSIRHMRNTSRRVINRLAPNLIISLHGLIYYVFFFFFFLIFYISYYAFWPGPFRINLELWILQTVGRTPWTGDRPALSQGPYLHRTTEKKCGQTFMPRVGFEPTIPVFERANIFHVSAARPL